MTSVPSAGWEGLLLPSKVPLAFEEDGAAPLILMQQGAVLEVGNELVLPLYISSPPSADIEAIGPVIVLTEKVLLMLWGEPDVRRQNCRGSAGLHPLYTNHQLLAGITLILLHWRMALV